MGSQNQTKLGKFLTTVLHTFGLWPNASSRMKRAYKIYSYALHFVTSFLFLFFLVAKLVTTMNNVETFIELLYPTLMDFAYIFKLLNYFVYGENIVNSYNKLLNLQLSSGLNDENFNLRLRVLRKLTSLLFCVTNFAWGMACIKSLLGSKTDLPIPSEYLLFDWREGKSYFWIACMHQSLAGTIMANSCMGMDCFTCYTMGMVAAHFEILQTHIRRIGSGMYESDVEEFEFTSSSIKLCVEEHQRILELVNDIEKYFSIQFVSQIFLSGVILSGGAYQLTIISPTEDLYQFVFVIAISMTVLTQTLLYTYFGNGVETTSDSVSDAVYSCRWYVLPVRFRKDLIVIMERVKRRCSIFAGKIFSLNLVLFTDIIYLTYRLFAVLLQRRNRRDF